MGVSVSLQILRWGPAGADRTPFISNLPLQTLFFCVYVRECVYVCVYASRLDLLSVGLMLKWLTAEQSQGRLRAVVGREGPYSLTAFSPEGERETNTEGDGRENLNRLIGHAEMRFTWINEQITVAKWMNVWLSQGPVGGLNKNGQDKISLTPDKKRSCFIITLLIPWSHGLETLGTMEVYGKWLILGEWCHI